MTWPRVGIALALLVATGGGPAASEPQVRCGPDWVALQGTVSRGHRCGVVVLTGAPGDTPASGRGRAQYAVNVPGRGTFALTLQRLTPDGGTLQVEVPGGYLLLADGQVGFYTSEAAWNQDGGFRPLPPPLHQARMVEPHRVEISVGARTITARLDGVEVGRWAVTAIPASGALAVWVTARGGHRPRVRLSDWTIPSS